MRVQDCKLQTSSSLRLLIDDTQVTDVQKQLIQVSIFHISLVLIF